jgi:hypothetical protein
VIRGLGNFVEFAGGVIILSFSWHPLYLLPSYTMSDLPEKPLFVCHWEWLSPQLCSILPDDHLPSHNTQRIDRQEPHQTDEQYPDPLNVLKLDYVGGIASYW